MKNKSISQARINQQIRSLQKQKLTYLSAYPLQSDIFTWHFTIQGPQLTDFHTGLYHGQMFLPFQYPFKPPDIVFMNSNGRFEINTKICLTITQYHPQEWNSAWTVRTMLEAVISLFNQNVAGVGYVEANSETRKYLAKQSHSFSCPKCGPLINILQPRKQISQSKPLQKQELDNIMPIITEDYQVQKTKLRQLQIISKIKSQEKILVEKLRKYNPHQKQQQKLSTKRQQNISKKVKLQRQEFFSYYQELSQAQIQLQNALDSVKWIDD